MTAALIGSVPEELDALAQQFLGAAETFDRIQSGIGGRLRELGWQGADGDGFRSDWDSSHAQALAMAATALREGAQRLQANATDQRAASDSNGGAAPTGGVNSGGHPHGSAADGGSGGDANAIPARDVPPDEVRDWWNSLTPRQRPT